MHVVGVILCMLWGRLCACGGCDCVHVVVVETRTVARQCDDTVTKCVCCGATSRCCVWLIVCWVEGVIVRWVEGVIVCWEEGVIVCWAEDVMVCGVCCMHILCDYPYACCGCDCVHVLGEIMFMMWVGLCACYKCVKCACCGWNYEHVVQVEL